MATNNMKIARLSFLLLGLSFGLATMAVAVDDKKSNTSADRLPVTTSSASAARHFENGMVQYENHRWNLALNEWHEAVRLDHKFALAYTWICMTTVDPAEESSSRARAKAAMKDVTPGEQLMV